MDPIDHANSLAEIERASALAATLRNFVPMKPTGKCRYCEDDIGDAKLFCDSWCRDEYENEQRMNRQLGHQR